MVNPSAATKPAAATKAVNSPERKAEAFKELASTRVNKALKAMRQLKYLSNKNAYTYTSEQIATIVAALNKATKEVEDSFKNPSTVKSEGFTL